MCIVRLSSCLLSIPVHACSDQQQQRRHYSRFSMHWFPPHHFHNSIHALVLHRYIEGNLVPVWVVTCMLLPAVPLPAALSHSRKTHEEGGAGEREWHFYGCRESAWWKMWTNRRDSLKRAGPERDCSMLLADVTFVSKTEQGVLQVHDRPLMIIAETISAAISTWSCYRWWH